MPDLKAARAMRTGVGVVALYALVAAATVSLSSRHVRPLFEGVGPTAPYQWVKPPPEFAAGNVKPAPATSDATLGARGSEATFAGTPDAQFGINVPENAIPPRPGVTRATITITPLDPATLGALPAGLAPDGNAYRLEIAYQPSGQPAGPLAAEGNLVLTVPDPVETILTSPDGKRWERVESQPVGNPTTIGSSFAKTGYYLGAEVRSATPPAVPRTGSKSKDALLVAGVAVLAGALVGTPILLRRRRQAQSERTPPRGRRQPHSGKARGAEAPRGQSAGRPGKKPKPKPKPKPKR